MTKEEFKYCYDHYFDPIRKYVYYKSGDINLSTDLSQEIFLKVWEKQLVFNQDRIKALLYRMARFHFIDYVRRNKLKENHLLQLDFEISNDGPIADLQFKELKAAYEKALSTLPEKQRTVFLMSRIENLSYKEIAERLAISTKAVEKRMSLALKTLRIRLGRNEKG